jgi:hypothetical protein
MGSFAFPAELIASSFTQNPETLANIKEMSKKYTEYFGINRKHMAGASVALSLIAEQKGSVEAVKYAFDNIGTFLKKGFDSVGFTLALAVGNVPVQIGMLATANAKVKPTLSNPFFRKVPILSKAYFTASTEPFCSAINERATEAPAICFLFIPKYSVYFLDISLILAKVSGF